MTHYKEHWVEIDGFPRYLVSNHGRIVNRLTDCVLKPSVDRQGYLHVTLCNNYTQQQILVHRVVAGSFFDFDIDGWEINHRNGIKHDCSIWNLEIVTPSQNVMHAYETGLHSSDSKFYPSRIINVDTSEVFSSTSEAARSVGVSPQRIASAVRHSNSRVRGFRFELLEEE